MEGTLAYFLGVLAFNIPTSLVAFAVAFSAWYKRYPITWLRGGVVLIGGWILGSVMVFVVHSVAAPDGFVISDELPYPVNETILAFIVLFPTMFVLLDVSRPKSTTGPSGF
jgi:hypothetical protein